MLHRRAKAIEHMPAQLGFDRYLRMIEFGVKPHPETLHHGTRFPIGDGGKGHEFHQVKLLKGECDGSLCGLRGITQAPVMFGEAPSRLLRRGRTVDHPMEHVSRRSR